MQTNKFAKVADLIIEELSRLIRQAVEEVLDEREKVPSKNQKSLLDLPPLSVGACPEGLKLLSREEIYKGC